MLLQPRPLRRRLVLALVVVDAALEVDEALLRVKLLAGRQFHLHGRLEVRLKENILFEVVLHGNVLKKNTTNTLAYTRALV